MARFRKGTMDHDGDGRRGGSMKGDDTMAKTLKAKKSAKAAEPVAAPRKRATRREDMPEAKTTPTEQQKAAEDQFAKADAAVIGNPDDPGEFRLRMAALGGL